MKLTGTIATLGLLWTTLAPTLGAQEVAADKKSARDDAETRLLEAELLEVSSGDLERALRIYTALAEAEETPEPTKARALLYMARCHRKRGQLEDARRILDTIVKQHQREAAVLRQARTFLRELDAGGQRAEFDWLGELARSPEIRARVFDLAMDLVDVTSDEAQRARRQLLALGTISVPVLEQMAQTSRDARHRRHLALILAHLGAHEWLRVALGAEGAPPFFSGNGRSTLGQNFREFIGYVVELPAAGRQRFLTTLESIAADCPAAYVECLRFVAGDHGRLQTRLPIMEEVLSVETDQRSIFGLAKRLGDIARADASQARIIAARLLEAPPKLRGIYYDLLDKTAPKVLGVTHWRRMLEDHVAADEQATTRPIFKERRPTSRTSVRVATPRQMRPGVDVRTLVAKLEAATAWQVLEAFTESSIATELLTYFANKYLAQDGPTAAPVEWAGILRNCDADFEIDCPVNSGGTHRLRGSNFALLHLLAEERDEFLDEFLDVLDHRRQEAPEFHGYGSRPEHWAWRQEQWTPSPRYVAAMTARLGSDDNVTLAIALEALSLSAPLAAEAQQAIESLLDTSTSNAIRELALYALLRHFETEPRYGTRAAELLMVEFLRRSNRGKDFRADGGSQRFEQLEQLRAGIKDLPDDARRQIQEAIGSPDPSAHTVSPVGANQLGHLSLPWQQTVESRRSFRRRVVDQRRSRRSSRHSTSGSGGLEVLGWIIARPVYGRTSSRREQTDELRDALYPHVLKFLGTEQGQAFHSWYGVASQDQLLDFAAATKDRAARAYVISQRLIEKRAEPDWEVRRLEILRHVAVDRNLPTEARRAAVEVARQRSLDWFSLEALLSDDPFIDRLMAVQLGGPEAPFGETYFSRLWRDTRDDHTKRSSAFKNAFKSPHAAVRRAAYDAYRDSAADAVEVYRSGLQDDDEEVRGEVIDHLTHTSRTDMAPLFLELLASGERSQQLTAIHGLKKFALADSLPAIGALLNDPNNDVRVEALKALNSIRDTLKERKEWQTVLQRLADPAIENL